MFTPSNIKKFVNVTIITLKHENTIFEVAIYPNTLQPFLQGLIPLESVISSDRIYKNVSKGELQTNSNILTLPGNQTGDKIEFILKNGIEKEDDLTRKTQSDKKNRQIALLLMKKLKYQKKRVSFQNALDIAKKYPCLGESKVIANGIIRDLISKNENYEVEKYLIKFHNENENNLKSADRKGEYFRIDGDELFTIRQECFDRKILYDLKFESDEEDEIIC